MLHRGRKILIIESSASKNAHPNVGDIGYLNNVYLFTKKKFILADAFFCQYKKDVDKNATRIEKKAFIIDLGMSSSLQYEIKKKGVTKRRLLNDSSMINLAPVMYNKSFFPFLISAGGIWLKKEPISTPIKIPIVNIANIGYVLSETRSLMSKAKEITSWYACFSEVIRASEFIGNNTSESARLYVRERINSKIKKIRNNEVESLYTIEKISKHTIKDPSSRNRLIKNVRLLSVLHNMWYYRMSNALFGTASLKDKASIAREWFKISMLSNFDISHLKFEGFHPKHAPKMVDYLRSFLFHSLFVSQNTRQSMKVIEEFLPINFCRGIEKFYSLCDAAKTDAHLDSAALTRVFDVIDKI